MNTEEHLLVCLAEECAEVIQRIAKAQRFGLDEVQLSNPEETRNNRQRINYEMNQLLQVWETLKGINSGYNDNSEESCSIRAEKSEKLRYYARYSAKLGILK